MNNETLPIESTTLKKTDLIKNACHDLQKVFRNQLKDLFRAEKKLAKALPRISMASNSKDRKEAYKNHLEETKSQVKRLDLIFELLRKKTEVSSKEPVVNTFSSNTLTAEKELSTSPLTLTNNTTQLQHVHLNSLKAITGLLNMKECHRLSFGGSNMDTPVVSNVHNVSFDLLEMNEEEIQVA
jgi:hypothetical protein